MHYLVLLIYLFLCFYWIKVAPYFKQFSIPRNAIGGLFLLKLGLGLIYGQIHYSYFQGGDTFIYLNESTLIGQTFLEHPMYYLQSLLGMHPPLPETTVFTYPPSAIFWKDLGTYMLVHIHALLYPLTRGYYELHIFFISIIGLLASLNFFRIFKQLLDLPKSLLYLLCFGLPSLSFWTAGLHKDVYVYWGLSLIFGALLALQQKKQPKQYWKLGAGLLIIALTRHYLLVLLFPAALVYGLDLYQKRTNKWRYLASYVGLASLVIALAQGIWGVNLLQILAEQQATFIAERGGSAILDIEPFEPTLWGVLRMVPIAIINVLGRPFLWECSDGLQLIAGLEIVAFWILLLAFLVVKKVSHQRANPLLNLMGSYAISNLFLIGLLVANVGTIARYRCIALAILVALLANLIEGITNRSIQALRPNPKPTHTKPNTTLKQQRPQDKAEFLS